MPEFLKNIYNKKFINNLANEFNNNYSRFDPDKFVNDIFSGDWKQKELKAGMRHIAVTLSNHLPRDYTRALGIRMDDCE